MIKIFQLKFTCLVQFLVAVCFSFTVASFITPAQQSSQNALTPLQNAVEIQRRRLGSAEVEERRDAVTALGSMHHHVASRAAVPALRDPAAIIRATAATAILSMPADESAQYLIPLLTDKDEFVRREAAFALGRTRQQSAVPTLIERLDSDKKDSVRGAAAVALGDIGDVTAVVSLTRILEPNFAGGSPGSRKKAKQSKDSFLLRSAARSLGQIRSKLAVPVLIATVQNEKSESDVRREAATSLGMIGDPTAIPALQTALGASDPHLARAAYDAIQQIQRRPKADAVN